MKYIKKFETISQDIKRGDLIIDIFSYIYLVLNDVSKNKRKIEVCEIGQFKYNNFSFNINIDTTYLYKNANLRLLNYDEKIKIFNIIMNIDKKISFNYIKQCLDKIKETSGINLTKIKEYIDYCKKYEIEQNANKYNL